MLAACSAQTKTRNGKKGPKNKTKADKLPPPECSQFAGSLQQESQHVKGNARRGTLGNLSDALHKPQQSIIMKWVEGPSANYVGAGVPMISVGMT